MTWRCLYCNQVGRRNVQAHTPFQVTDAGKGYLYIIERQICPNPECTRAHVEISISGAEVRSVQLHPRSRARQSYAETVPAGIFADYDEACAVEDLSPKASAALARRSLQGVLKNFYGRDENRLVDQIKNLKGHVDSTLWEALDAMRGWGNIAAHPDEEIVDIEPGTTRRLISVLEVLFDESYVAKARRDALLKEVADSI